MRLRASPPAFIRSFGTTPYKAAAKANDLRGSTTTRAGLHVPLNVPEQNQM